MPELGIKAEIYCKDPENPFRQFMFVSNQNPDLCERDQNRYYDLLSFHFSLLRVYPMENSSFTNTLYSKFKLAQNFPSQYY